MTGEQSGPAGPKLARLLCFVGAGLIVTVGANKWKVIEQRSTVEVQKLPEPRRQVHKNPANAVPSAVK